MNTVFMDQDVYKDFSAHTQYLEPLEKLGTVVSYGEDPTTDDEKYERMKDADVVAFGVQRISNELIDRLPKLKLLQYMGVGHVNFADVDHCKARGIKFFNIEDYGSNAVAEYALALAFALARKIAVSDRRMRAREWRTEGLSGIEIAGCTFGVLGTGNIGRIVATSAKALGADVIASDIYESSEVKAAGIPYVTKEELFERADVLSLHVKLTDSTHGIVNRGLISRLKSSAIVVNTSRSQIADTEALVEALREGRIAGLALDVFDEEPLENFDICMDENIITSPHVGYNSENAKRNMLRMTVESILANYTA